MAILGKLLKKGIQIRESLEQQYSSPYDLQKSELKKLLISAHDTSFGKKYGFEKILKSFSKKARKDFYQEFKDNVPIHDYDKIFEEWWYKNRQGKRDICWPGKVKYFAMSSGTSGDSSKYIPVTKDMLKAMKKTSIRQILSLSRYDLHSEQLEKGILMLGGSTKLRKAESFYDGDLSGITASKIPFWFQHFYKPGKKISQNRDWQKKLDEITLKADSWDIGVIVGVPAWIQLLLEKIIAYYKLEHIHQIWPNLKIFVHGGVAFEPYKKGFEKLLGKELIYMETYLASEGFLAFQAYPGQHSMKMVLNNGLFYEFVPFNDRNFDSEGKMKGEVETLMIDEVEENTEYAILLSTCAGAWRYLIGDVIKFTSLENPQILITGRTKHFLSLCGEHLSVDNMNKAVQMTEEALQVEIREFTVAGVPDGSLFSHKWFIGTDDEVDTIALKEKIDTNLKEINDDYATERKYALQNVLLEVVPANLFYEFMRQKGKEGSQNKFPRVMKGEKYQEWEAFLQQEKTI